MSEICIVTHGNYEDYRIVAVFLDIKKAENFIEKIRTTIGGFENAEEFEVESYKIETYTTDPEDVPIIMYEVVIDKETGEEVSRKNSLSLYSNVKDEVNEYVGTFEGCSKESFEAALKLAKDKFKELKGEKKK